MIKHVQDSGLIHTLRVFANILFVIGNELPLRFKRAFKRTLRNKLADNRRHPTQNAVVEKQPATY